MKRLLLTFLFALPAFAQLPFAIRTGSGDITSTTCGQVVMPTFAVDDGGNPQTGNLIHSDGEFWDTGDDSVPDSILDGYSSQIVTDKAGLTTGAADYCSITPERAVHAYVCRDNDNTNPYPAGWTATEVTVTKNNRPMTCLKRDTCSASAFDVPGNDGNTGTEMMVIFTRDCTKPLTIQTPSGGTAEFAADSITADENTNVNFTVQRSGGSQGSCDIGVSEGIGAANITLIDSDFIWNDSEAGSQTGDVSLGEVGSDTFATLNMVVDSGTCTLGSPSVLTLNITDTGSAPTDTEYYVDQGLGDDSNDGTSAGAGAWQTIGRANSVIEAAAAGHTNVNVDTATYNGKPDLANSGTDASNRIRWIPDNGDVTLSDGGKRQFGVEMDTDWTAMLDDSGNEFIIEGGCNAQRLVDIRNDTDCDIQKAGNITGNNNIVEVTVQNTEGYAGLTISGVGNVIQNSSFDEHGNPWNIADSDFGDSLTLNFSRTETNTNVVQDSTFVHCGHTCYVVRNGNPILRDSLLSSEWSDVATYNAREGSRIFTVSRDADGAVMEHNLIRFNGRPSDNSNPPMGKLGGDNTTSPVIFRWNYVLDGIAHGIQCRRNASDRSCQNVYIVHNDFYSLEGPAVAFRSVSSGDGFSMAGNKVANNNFVSVLTNPDSNGDGIITLDGSFNPEGAPLTDEVLEVFCNTFPSSSSLVEVRPSQGGDGVQMISYYEENFPSSFHDNFFGDPDYANANTNPGSLSQAATDFAVGTGSVSENAACALSQTVGGGTNSTDLKVEDAGWWHDGYGAAAPDEGPDGSAGCWQIRNIDSGWTACITDVDMSTNPDTITLSSSQTWSDGDGLAYVNTNVGASTQ